MHPSAPLPQPSAPAPLAAFPADPGAPAPAPDRETLRRRGRRLEWLTLALSAGEAAVGIAAGLRADSVALLGFGLDSLIEMASALVLLWRFLPARPGGARWLSERQALRLVGICLFLLGAYVAWQAVADLWLRARPERSPVGMALAVASLVAMPLLARAKRRVAAPLHSAALRADALQADVCAWLAAVTLAGLSLNAVLGWWWADPVAALCMVPLIAREGVRALRGQACGCAGCELD
ncbi:MAG TPA: cation transporter [Candidatus Saccharimonadales bacterium]|nr:cation transporter [Candidatus Saccharimonadales bacterium]